MNATCVFGANNRESNLQKTGGWADFLYDFNYYPGDWQKKTQALGTTSELESSKVVGKWVYEIEEIEGTEELTAPDASQEDEELEGNSFIEFEYVPRDKQFDPIMDVKFNLTEEQESLLYETILTSQFRFANCRQQSNLAFSYLWEHAGVTVRSIELVGMCGFDHTLVLVNRRVDSDKDDPATWGEDCYFIDPWFNNEGTFRRGQDFTQYVENELKQDIQQNVAFPNIKEDVDCRFFVITEVHPAERPYPRYAQNFSVTDYYHDLKFVVVSRDSDVEPSSCYEEMKQTHKESFNLVLKSLPHHTMFRHKPQLVESPQKTSDSYCHLV